MRDQQIVNIPVASIQPDPENLRKVFDEEELQALADNIKEHGQLDPVQVFERSVGTYDLWDGERRWRAAQLASLPTLRAIVVPRPSDVDLLCKKISRFMQTKTLSKPEEVRALEQGLGALGVLDDQRNGHQQQKNWVCDQACCRNACGLRNFHPNCERSLKVVN